MNVIEGAHPEEWCVRASLVTSPLPTITLLTLGGLLLGLPLETHAIG